MPSPKVRVQVKQYSPKPKMLVHKVHSAPKSSGGSVALSGPKTGKRTHPYGPSVPKSTPGTQKRASQALPKAPGAKTRTMSRRGVLKGLIRKDTAQANARKVIRTPAGAKAPGKATSSARRAGASNTSGRVGADQRAVSAGAGGTSQTYGTKAKRIRRNIMAAK